jgi:hypothetical protein
MSGEVENAQAEMNSKALEGFLVGNQDLERLDALLDAHHLLRLRGDGEWKHAFGEEKIEIFLAIAARMRCAEQCWHLKPERDGHSDGLCRARVP